MYLFSLLDVFLVCMMNIDVISACELLTAEETPQTFESPNFPGDYPRDTAACWTITATDTTVQIHLEIVSFHTEQEYDVLSIYDGGDSSAPLLVEWSGFVSSQPVYSSANWMHAEFHSDSLTEKTGFRLNYQIFIDDSTSCSALEATSTAERLYSPDFPFTYANNLALCWVIRADDGGDLYIRFDYLDLQFDLGCDRDSVTIKKGSSAAGEVIGSYCGSNPNTQIIRVTDGASYVAMTTNSQITGTGFVITYSTTKLGNVPKCEYLLATSTPGVFTSSNYPAEYPSEFYQCFVVITGTANLQVQLAVLDFLLEDDCRFDHVRIREGYSVNDEVVLTICGDKFPETVISETSAFHIEFESDDSFEKRGFQIQYAAVPDISCSQLTASTSNAYVTSPGYPNNYQNNHDECWLIKTDNSTQRIRLEITVLDILSSNNCERDYLHVRDGTHFTAPSLLKLCGSIEAAEVVLSSGLDMFLHFHSDVSGRSSGFSARYQTVDISEEVPCVVYQAGTSLNIFTSPDSPQNYPPSSNLCWQIVAQDESKIIQFTLLSLDLEERNARGECQDYLQISDGGVDKSPVLGLWCGMLTDVVTIETTQASAHVQFISNGAVQSTGFRIEFSQIASDEDSSMQVVQMAAAGAGVAAALIIITISIIVICFRCRKTKSKSSEASTKNPPASTDSFPMQSDYQTLGRTTSEISDPYYSEIE